MTIPKNMNRATIAHSVARAVASTCRLLFLNGLDGGLDRRLVDLAADQPLDDRRGGIGSDGADVGHGGRLDLGDTCFGLGELALKLGLDLLALGLGLSL